MTTENDLSSLVKLLKSRLSLPEAMAEHGIEVKKAGRGWTAKCFIHDEKKPSLSISDNGLYHCFSPSCPAKGDIITFYQQKFNLDFREAVERIANDCDVDTSRFKIYTEGEQESRRLSGMLGSFHSKLCGLLVKHDLGKEARAHLKKRGVSLQSATRFEIGFSPSVDHAVKIARSCGAGADDVKSLELDRKGLFGGKLIFPVVDIRGIGRFSYSTPVSDADQAGPKYIGPSASNPLRRQGQMFGLQVAREEIGQAGQLVLVEGFYDVLVLHSHGIRNVAGLLGSSVTADHYGTLSAIQVQRATFLFDADKAGLTAAEKVVHGGRDSINVRIATLPEGDPDEFVIKQGKEALESVVEQAISPAEFVVSELTDLVQSPVLDDRIAGLRRASEVVYKLLPEERILVLSDVAKLLNIDRADLQDILSLESDESTLADERAILGTCLVDVEKIDDVGIKIGNRSIWPTMEGKATWEKMNALLAKEATELGKDFVISQVGDDIKLATYIKNLPDTAAQNLEFHVGRLVDHFDRRNLKRQLDKLTKVCADKSVPIAKTIADHLAAVSSAVAPSAKHEFDSSEQVETAMSYIHERMESDGALPGIDMGEEWSDFTKLSLGWQKGYVYILSALPKVGKTNTALNWAMQSSVVHAQTPTLWINMEMSHRDLALRNLSILSGISNTRLRMGAIGEKEKVKLDEAAERYYSAPFYVVNGASYTLHELVSIVRKHVYTKGVQLVFIDYIQLIKHGKDDKAWWEKNYEISAEIKRMAESLMVPVVAVSQLSKASVEGGALHQGGGIKYIQDCDMAMELRRRTKQEVEEDPSGNLLLNVEFNRHGQQGTYINLIFDQENLRCREM